MKKFCQGFIDPISLFALGFLVVSLIVGVVAVRQKQVLAPKAASCAAGCVSCSCGCACYGNTCSDICPSTKNVVNPNATPSTKSVSCGSKTCTSPNGTCCNSGCFPDGTTCASNNQPIVTKTTAPSPTPTPNTSGMCSCGKIASGGNTCADVCPTVSTNNCGSKNCSAGQYCCLTGCSSSPCTGNDAANCPVVRPAANCTCVGSTWSCPSTSTQTKTSTSTQTCTAGIINTAGTCPDGKTIKYVRRSTDCSITTDTCTGAAAVIACQVGAIVNTAGTCPDGKTVIYVRLNADCKTTTTDKCTGSAAIKTCTPAKINTAGTCPDGTIKYVRQNADCTTTTDTCPTAVSTTVTAPNTPVAPITCSGKAVGTKECNVSGGYDYCSTDGNWYSSTCPLDTTCSGGSCIATVTLPTPKPCYICLAGSCSSTHITGCSGNACGSSCGGTLPPPEPCRSCVLGTCIDTHISGCSNSANNCPTASCPGVSCDGTRNANLALINSCKGTPSCNTTTGVWTCIPPKLANGSACKSATDCSSGQCIHPSPDYSVPAVCASSTIGAALSSDWNNTKQTVQTVLQNPDAQKQVAQGLIPLAISGVAGVVSGGNPTIMSQAFTATQGTITAINCKLYGSNSSQCVNGVMATYGLYQSTINIQTNLSLTGQVGAGEPYVITTSQEPTINPLQIGSGITLNENSGGIIDLTPNGLGSYVVAETGAPATEISTGQSLSLGQILPTDPVARFNNILNSPQTDTLLVNENAMNQSLSNSTQLAGNLAAGGETSALTLTGLTGSTLPSTTLPTEIAAVENQALTQVLPPSAVPYVAPATVTPGEVQVIESGLSQTGGQVVTQAEASKIPTAQPEVPTVSPPQETTAVANTQPVTTPVTKPSITQQIFGEPKTVQVNNLKPGTEITLYPGDQVSGVLPNGESTSMVPTLDSGTTYYWRYSGVNTPVKPLTSDGIPLTVGGSTPTAIYIDTSQNPSALSPFQVTMTNEQNVPVTITRANPEPGILTIRDSNGNWFPGIKNLLAPAPVSENLVPQPAVGTVAPVSPIAQETPLKVLNPPVENVVQTTPAEVNGNWVESHPQYGTQIGSGASKVVYQDSKGIVSLLFRNPDDSVMINQLNVYRKANGAEGLLPKFLGEITDQTGTVIGYKLTPVTGESLGNIHDLTVGEIQQAIKDLDQLHQITGETHGDITDHGLYVNVVVTPTELPNGTIQRRINFGLDYGATGASGATPISNLTSGKQQIELSQELDTLTNELIFQPGRTKSPFISDSTFSEIQNILQKTANNGQTLTEKILSASPTVASVTGSETPTKPTIFGLQWNGLSNPDDGSLQFPVGRATSPTAQTTNLGPNADYSNKYAQITPAANDTAADIQQLNINLQKQLSKAKVNVPVNYSSIVNGLIEQTGGPLIEIGGPTFIGFRQINISTLKTPMTVSNITNGSNNYNTQTGKLLGTDGKVDIILDATNMNMPPESVGAFYTNALGSDVIPKFLQEANTVLKSGGVVILDSTENEWVLPESQKLGFRVVEYSNNPIDINGSPSVNITLQKAPFSLPEVTTKPTIFGLQWNGFTNSTGNLQFPIGSIPSIPPITSGQVFDPNVEVQNILKLPSADRPVALADFKAKLAYQQKGIADIQTTLENAITKNPDISTNDLTTLANNLTAKYGLADWQKSKLDDALNLYNERQASIDNVFNQYPSPNDMYEAMFGKQPFGKINISKGPMTINIKVYNTKDYDFIYSGNFRNPQSVPTSRGSNSTGGFFMPSGTLLPNTRGLIVIENNTSLLSRIMPTTTIMHEEQHALNNLLQEADISPPDYMSNYQLRMAIISGDQNSISEILPKYIDSLKLSADSDATDEILAYLKTGTPNGGVVGTLTTSGHYGFYDDALSAATVALQNGNPATSIPSSQMDQISQELGPQAYKKTVQDGVNAFDTLIGKGYTRDEAVAALGKVPLSDWPKFAGRAQTPALTTRITSYISGKVFTPEIASIFSSPVFLGGVPLSGILFGGEAYLLNNIPASTITNLLNLLHNIH